MRNFTILKPLAALVLAAIAIISMLQAHDNVVQLKDEQTDSLEKLFNMRSQAIAEERLYLSTNQPIYNPGENIWFTVFLKNAQLRKSDKSDIIHVELLAPSGNVVQTMNLIARNGVCGGDFGTNTTMAGGYYKVKAYTNWMRNENDSIAFEKEVLLQKVILPRVKMNLTFDKDSYTKGEEVISKFSVSTNENKPLRNKSFTYELKADGLKFKEGTSTTGDDGVMYVRYNLPAKLKTRDVQMNVKIENDGLTESINKPVPVSSENISVEFFPEGGDMIAGLPARVAFRTWDENGKALSVEGVIKDSKGKEVCKLETYHKGMGSCYFTPQSGETYTASITKPKEISKTWNLPVALQHGFNMEVKSESKDIQVNLRSTGMFKAMVIAQVRGKIYFSTSRVLNEGDNMLSIPVSGFPAGVAQISVFDQQMTPRAERLVFVNRDRQMQISIQTEREQYQSRDKVKTTVRTLDENGNPIPAIVSAKVVNDQLLSYADDKSSNLLSAMLLEYDLKEKIDEPNFYFDKSEAKSTAALDLVMMTSGWRRFTWKQVLNKEIPLVKKEGELATFSIQVVDGNTGKPIPDAQLKLNNSGSVYQTDKNGKALFTNIDLYETAVFTITAGNYNPGSVQVTSYTSNNTVWLYSKNYMLEEVVVENVGVRHKNIQLVPQMNMMVNEDAVMFGAPQHSRNVIKHKETAQNKVPVKNVEQVKDDESKNLKDEEIVVADNRVKGLFKFDSIVENNQIKVTTYYRSREFPVRKYSASSNYTRTDFASTLFFKHAIETDLDGKAVFEFPTNDLITSFKIIAEGVSNSGLAGRGEKLIFTQLPVTISSKTPGTLTSGDVLSLPVIVKNNSSKTLSGKLSVKFNEQVFASAVADTTLSIAPQTAQVVYRRFTAQQVQMNDTLLLSFMSSDFSDETTVPVKVESRGFPVQQSFSGRDLDRTFSLRIKDALPGSMKVSLTAYPSTVSTILQGISGLLRRPGGCFEQTSMSSYPNAMIMDYLKNSETGDEKVYAQAKELLTEGYNKLVTFETKQKGYEWFGSAPGHEALTAYGLMQFNEYKKLYSGVDESMIKRTADWLMARRDGKGGYLRDGKALDYFGRASEEVTNVYITYALSEAGYGDIQKEVDYAYQTALASSDPYVLALVANTLYNKKDLSRANTVLEKLVKSQSADGAMKGAKQSITCSTGQGLDVETTSLSLLAMMQSNNPDYVKAEKAASYLVNARSGYGDWGNTQATILALKALSKFSLFSKRTAESGTITVYLNDEAIGEASFKAGENGTIEIKGLEKFVKEGSHNLKIKYKGCKVALPYSVNVTYNIGLPPSSEDCDVQLQTSLNTKQCRVGDMVRMNVEIENLRNEGKPSTTAIIGIPAGLSIQAAALKTLQEQNKIAYFEIWENNLVIYLRQMKPEEKLLVPVDLKAEVPGVFEAAASNVFLYYSSEYKNWVAGEQITISK